MGMKQQHVFNERVARERLAEYLLDLANVDDLARLTSEFLLDDEVIITADSGQESRRFLHGRPIAGWLGGGAPLGASERTAQLT
jgi:hypothetical protein